MPHLYEAHLGGKVYRTEMPQNYDQLYCEQCGDSDWYLGEYTTFRELLALVRNRYGDYKNE